MSTPLIIYKASAGSGKTFTLATEYIKLVVRNPQAYRKILAVTFTNKATEEMKVRILSQLYGIWKRLPSSDDYMKAVCESLDDTPEHVSQQAGLALSNLLHNYSYFRVDTIDSFFQSILRNLARELDLTANLRVGLNDGQVEELAVDNLIENLSAKDQMLQWILKYIMDTISDDRSWNVIKQVKQFGRAIFNDNYKAESKHLYQIVREPKFFDGYMALLNSIKKEARETMTNIADEFFQLLSDNGFTYESLSYGKGGVAGVFLKLKDGQMDESIVGKRAEECLDAPEKWYKKSDPRRDELHALAGGPLNDLLHRVINERPLQWKRYKSADLTLKHLSQLRLLESIERKVRELNEESNRFLLSDTQQMLHELIDGSDSPFIFEKIGTQLEHIMIDEFQDTSTVQWKNFKVLLQETMSHEDTENLIVGDVKQSIYRWRSGDWRLLANIHDEFEHADQQLEIKPLETNYRSERHVVEFNNAFFAKAAELEGIAAYDDVSQKVPLKRGNNGFVNITLLPSDDYQQQTLESLKTQVEELVGLGIPTSEIAILVRVNRQIPLIANYFMEHLPQVSVVSDEAFRLDASPAIQTIIQALRLLTRPDDLIAKAFLAKAYSHQALYTAPLDELLPPQLVEGRNELLRLPLYELTERLCAIFKLNETTGQTAYLCAFYDQVSTFVNEQMTDIASFLKEWDETICSKTIQSPDINGIRLISIHKSKGLEFPYVLIPFCDWKLELGGTLWCHPQEEPFNQLPIVPIDYSKSGMTGTIYQSDYDEESMQNMVDNMNLLYVGFTRAVKGLYIWGKRGGKGHRSAIIEQVLPQMEELLQAALKTEQLEGFLLEGKEDVGSALHFEYGTPPCPTPSPADLQVQEEDEVALQKALDDSLQKERNVFLQKAEPLPLQMKMFEQKAAFKQSNLSRQFAAQEDEQQQTNYIQLGSILHNVFSTIRTKKDIDAALQQMELDGIIYDQQLTREKIETLIRKRLEDPRVAYWYAEKWQLFNECTILNIDPTSGNVYERRPDRVMTDGNEMIVVDFKFGRPNTEYHDQVREYMHLLADMGYPNIKGYLWYVYSNKIEEVK